LPWIAILLEGVLLSGAVLAFGFWELHKLRKLRRRRLEQDDDRSERPLA